jgi:hypothetical protein
MQQAYVDQPAQEETIHFMFLQWEDYVEHLIAGLLMMKLQESIKQINELSNLQLTAQGNTLLN